MDERAFGKMEGRMDAQEERLVRIESNQDRTETKIDQILEWRWKMWGVTFVVGLLGSGIFELILARMQAGK